MDRDTCEIFYQDLKQQNAIAPVKKDTSKLKKQHFVKTDFKFCVCNTYVWYKQSELFKKKLISSDCRKQK